MRFQAVPNAALVLIGVSLVFPVECARILAVVTLAGKSHWSIMSAVLGELTASGHHVTVFTPFPDGGSRENYTEVDVSDVFSKIVAWDVAELRRTFNGFWPLLRYRVAAERQACDGFYRNERMSGLVKDGLQKHFDAVLHEPGITNCVQYVAAGSDLPFVYLTSLPSVYRKPLNVLGHVPNPAIVSTKISDCAILKTSAQRFSNAFSCLCDNVLIAIWEALVETFDPKPYDSRPSVTPSLVLLNGHFATEVSSPDPANVIRVGGIHLRPPKRLPEDIFEFIENSPHGVVLFTFGSTVAMTSVPEDIKKVLLDVLAQLPQRVLFKYEAELKDKPKNVMTKKWLPQRDILKHSNVKLFISHGGISGVYETVDAGVPVLGFPLFFDQYRNIDHLVESGMAISMDIFSITETTLLENVLKLLNNNTYTENAKKVSTIFNDRPLTPQKSVVYWTEYVIRHKGASHLKSAGYKLTWYQYFMLDVLFVVLLIICVSLLMVYKIYKIVKLKFTTNVTMKMKSQ